MKAVDLAALVLLAIADTALEVLDLRAVALLLRLGAHSPDIAPAAVEEIIDACRADLCRAGCPVDEREVHATLLAALDRLCDGEPVVAAETLARAEMIDTEAWIAATSHAHGVEVVS